MESISNRYPRTSIDLFLISRVVFQTHWKKSIVFTDLFPLNHTHSKMRSSSKIHTATYIFTYPAILISTSTLTQHAKSKKKTYTHHPILVAIARKRHSRTNQNKPTLREIVGDPLVNWKSIFFNKKTKKTLRINNKRDTFIDENVNSFNDDGLSVIVLSADNST